MSDDPRCAKCGHPRSNHPYRHPFVGPTRDDTINEQRARIAELEAKLAKAVEVLELADSNLTNLQPKIPQLIPRGWVPVVDGYVDPVITEARATLAELKGDSDD